MAVAKFGFGVELEDAKHRSGLGRCEASFITVCEETLHTCPNPSPASSDGDDKTISFFLLFYLTK